MSRIVELVVVAGPRQASTTRVIGGLALLIAAIVLAGCGRGLVQPTETVPPAEAEADDPAPQVEPAPAETPTMDVSPGETPEPDVPDEIADEPASDEEPVAKSPEELRSRALDLQRDAKWCEAEKAWEQLLEVLNSVDDERDPQQFREEAEQNLEIVAKRCRPSGDEVLEVELPEPAPEDLPEEVAEEELLDYYPFGQKVRLVGLADITGLGNNKGWIFDQDAYFAYTYRILAETRVHKAPPDVPSGRRIFRIAFYEVRQTRVVYEEAIRLRPIDNPIMTIFLSEFDRRAKWHPLYQAGKTIAELIQLVDPKGERLLTWWADRLRSRGMRIPRAALCDVAEKIEELEGTVVEVEYISGLGVSHVSVVEGNRRDPDDLEQLAYTTSVLMDYYIFPNRDAEVGERWEVRAEDVASMIPFGYGYRPRGRIGVQRAKNAELGGQPVRTLHLDPGSTVQIEARGRRVDEEATARIITGVVDYCPNDLLVRRARIAWDGTTTAMSKDHLLFGTENIRNLEVETYYEAYKPDAEPIQD